MSTTQTKTTPVKKETLLARYNCGPVQVSGDANTFLRAAADLRSSCPRDRRTTRDKHGATGGRPIHTILGGLHLLNATPELVDKTIAAFRRFDVQRLAPAHCTGLRAVAQLWTAFPEHCVPCAMGTNLSFPR